VWAEQAIFTSLPRVGKAGYHLVSRSQGVSDVEAGALTTWSPSHGALIIDSENRTSVNFHDLPGGRYALSRTCAGLAEYSGRGGRQLYTHTLIIDDKTLKQAGNQPWAVYRHALALGYLHYRPEPETRLSPVRLCSIYHLQDKDYWTEKAASFGLASPRELVEQLTSEQTVELAYSGDRTLLAECLIALVPPEIRPRVSFATSLRPSMVRPYRFVLLDGGAPPVKAAHDASFSAAKAAGRTPRTRR
jgi:GTPase-associated protein 1, N-terminal domain type 2